MIRKFSVVSAVALTAVLALSACKGKGGADFKLEGTQLEKLDQAMALAKKSKGDGDPQIWKMSDEDTDVYLFGTVHLLPEGVNWKSNELTAILNNMDTLYIEADIESPGAQQAMAASVMQHGMFTDGKTLSGVLGDNAAVVEKAAGEFGIPFAQIQTLKPWMVGLQMTQMKMMQDGFSPDMGVEANFTGVAKNRGVPIKFLETAADQISAISGGSMEEQVEGLVFQAQHMDKTEEVLDLLVNEWADGDVKGLEIIAANPEAMGSEGMYDRLLVVRNQNWIPKIEAILAEPGTKLVAVGAGHLAGEHSVVKLLEANGLKVELVQ